MLVTGFDSHIDQFFHLRLYLTAVIFPFFIGINDELVQAESMETYGFFQFLFEREALLVKKNSSGQEFILPSFSCPMEPVLIIRANSKNIMMRFVQYHANI